MEGEQIILLFLVASLLCSASAERGDRFLRLGKGEIVPNGQKARNDSSQFFPIDKTGCKVDKTGVLYRGEVSVTKSNIPCQRWDKQTPHVHQHNYYNNNFCRNPDAAEGPWCYTTDPSKRWEYCDIPFCECKVDKMGTKYEGRKSETKDGLTCQRWDSQSPQRHLAFPNARFPDGSAQAAENFCRNPDSTAEGPWCYTTNPSVRWQYCDIPSCDCKLDLEGKQYQGETSVTRYGNVCQRWDSQVPHGHYSFGARQFPDHTVTLARNYCRNPNSSPLGPWCYTTDATKKWEYCDIPYCEYVMH